ncbi:MAG: ABC transporter permease, partial [Armatimonadetes bacterium]|nr:ABC transporter permease [Armatimonadota bacterium]NIO98095.1 ABC transporter permease [Armatimonadota bacterium]
VLFLVVPILCLSLMALGMGLMISSAAVYFADVMPTYEVLLLAWMYLTPVIYPVEVLPENVQSLLRFNPLFYP